MVDITVRVRLKRMALRTSRYILALVSLNLLVVCGLLRAQSATTGAILGTVTDPTGAVTPGANVAIKNNATGLERKYVTDDTGKFLAPFLPAGAYTVTVELKGFAPFTARDMQVQITETTTLQVGLQVASATQEITVTGAAPLLQSQNTSIGRVIERSTIVDLPLVNRNYTQLLGLTTGVNTEVVDATAIGVGSQEIRANGGRSSDNSFQINGVPGNTGTNLTEATSFGAGGISIPAPDSIQEFKVLTSLYDAQYGRAAGANVNLETRSGGAEYHGSVYYFHRNDVLNANNFFANTTGTKRGKFLRSQPGATIGGPLLPFLPSWRNRVFFFGSYQATRDVNGASLASSIRSLTLPPIPLDRSPESLGSVFGGQTGAFGGLAVASDGSNINPVALALLNVKNPDGTFLIPSPQKPGGGVNYTATRPGRFQDSQFNTNLDVDLGPKDHLSTKFFRANQDTIIPFFGANVPGFPSLRLTRNRNVSVSYTHTLSPNLVIQGRAGYSRVFGRSAAGGTILDSQVGIKRFSDPEVGILPQFQVGGVFALGNSPNDRGTTAANSIYWADTLSYGRGNHNFKVGYEGFRDQFNIAFTFDLGNITILSFPDFLLGRPGGPIAQGGNGTAVSNVFGSSISGGPPTIGDRQIAHDFFIQDDWRVRPNLTLNLGLRIEVNGKQSEVAGRLSNFDPKLFKAPPPGGFTDFATSGFVIASNFRGTPVPPGVQRGNKTLQDDNYDTHVEPRIGVAWEPFAGRKFVVRAGYGIFASRVSFLNHAQQLVFIPPFAAQTLFFGPANVIASLQDPFPDLPKSATFPNFDTLRIPGPPFNRSRIPVSPNLSVTNLLDTNVQHWALDLQYQVKDFVFTAGYAGAKGTHLIASHSISQPLLASPDNPVNGETTNSADNAILRSPFLGVSPFNLQQDSSANSEYHSFQASAKKSMGHGFQFLVSYTLAKSLDDAGDSLGAFGFGGFGVPTLGQDVFNDQNNRRAQHARSDFDRRHRLVASGVWELPAPKFQTPWLRKITEGWSVSGVLTLQSGRAFSIFDSGAGSIFGSPTFFKTASLAPGGNLASEGSVTSRLNQFFNTSAVMPAPAVKDGDLIDGKFPVSGGGGTLFGNLGRNILSGPDQRNLDIRFGKRTSIKEKLSVVILWEMFNALNRADFDIPGSDIANPGSFGVISGLTVNPRIMQVGAKFEF